MYLVEESAELKDLNELFVKVLPSMPMRVTNSIYYNKLKYLLFQEIVTFCKEKLDLKKMSQLVARDIK